MSRLEKTRERKTKKRKMKFIMKILFILALAVNTMICIFVVDSRARKMLGEDDKSDSLMNSVQISINETLKSVNKLAVNIKEQFNK